MIRRRFIQMLAGGLIAAKMSLPLGAIPRIESVPIPSGNVLTVDMLRRAYDLMIRAAARTPETVVYCHPRDAKRYREMFS